MRSIAPQVTDRLDAIRQLCRRYHVGRLELFGSAATGEFDELSSDVDFLVDLRPVDSATRADDYFGLLADLQDLFGRNIDLVEVGAITNPYFKRAIESTRTVLYAA
jgi:predicted nucleotidyltransferase